MVMVNARDAQAYADWALKQLPTEAQWEMAARGTDGRLFPSGPEPIKYSKPRAARQAEPVMSYPEDVSPYGVYDMAGNVWEWTKDWYDSKYYRQLSGQPIDNPTGPSVPSPDRSSSWSRAEPRTAALHSAREWCSTSASPTLAFVASCRSRSRRAWSIRPPVLPGQLSRPAWAAGEPARREEPGGAGSLLSTPEQRADPDQGRHRVMRHPRRFIFQEPAHGPLDGLTIRKGRRPAQPGAGLLGAVFEVTAQQPGPVASDPRRFLGAAAAARAARARTLRKRHTRTDNAR